MSIDHKFPTLDELEKANLVAKADTHWGTFKVLKNDFIGRKMIQGEHFEDRLVQVLLPYIQKGDVVMDIGANLGAFTIPFAKTVGVGMEGGGLVYACEPQFVMRQLLDWNLRENCSNGGLGSSVKVLPVAVGHQNMMATMSSRNDNMLDVNYLNEASRISNFGGLSLGQNGEPVQMVMLDSLMPTLQKIKLIKIDVEGAEPLVIWGGRELIKRDLPIIFWEKNHKTINPEMERGAHVPPEVKNFVIGDFLASLGYTFERHDFNILGLPPSK